MHHNLRPAYVQCICQKTLYGSLSSLLLKYGAYLTSASALSTSAGTPRSILRIEVPLARAKPAPLVVQPLSSKALTTCLPNSPVAPVTRAVFPAILHSLRCWFPGGC